MFQDFDSNNFYKWLRKIVFSCVWFGNVMGRGSVIPLFKKHIRNGGPVTVTDLLRGLSDSRLLIENVPKVGLGDVGLSTDIVVL